MAAPSDHTRVIPIQSAPEAQERPAPEVKDDLDLEGPPSLIAEFKWFLKENKKWWMLPLIFVFAGMASLLYLGGTALAPFIYSLF